MEKHVISEPGDIDKLTPVDPTKDKYWSVPLRAADILQKKIGNEVAVVGAVDTPLIVCSELRGYENLLMDMVNRPELVEQMIDVVVESEIMYGEALEKIGIETVFMEEGMAGGNQVGPDVVTRFDIEHVKHLIAEYKKRGLRTIVHNCSEMPYLDLESTMGENSLHFNNGYVDLASVFERLRGKLCLMSGINHQEVMYKRTPKDVETSVKDVIDLYGKEPGLIIAPGCEMPFKTPLENIVALRSAVEKYGTY